MEFSGACEGCGETPYVKLLTQLFGTRMVVANATGCSSIWGGSAPSNPYTCDDQGRGPAWANSLFEDNAQVGGWVGSWCCLSMSGVADMSLWLGCTPVCVPASTALTTANVLHVLNPSPLPPYSFPPAQFGFGIAFGLKQRRQALAAAAQVVITEGSGSEDLRTALAEWLPLKDNGALAGPAGAAVAAALAALPAEAGDNGAAPSAAGVGALAFLQDHTDLLDKPSVWIVGGDGWAYDVSARGRWQWWWWSVFPA